MGDVLLSATTHHLWQVGELALRSREPVRQPSISLAEVLGKTGLVSHLSNTVELTLSGAGAVEPTLRAQA